MTWRDQAGRKQGSTRTWRIIRATVLERDGHVCQIRGPRCTGVATQVHHLKPWHGRADQVPLDQLAAACQPCNGSEGEPVAAPTIVTRRTSW